MGLESYLTDWITSWGNTTQYHVNTPPTVDILTYPFSYVFVPCYLVFLLVLSNFLPYLGSYRLWGHLVSYILQGIPLILGLTGYGPRSAIYQIGSTIHSITYPDKIIRSLRVNWYENALYLTVIAILCFIAIFTYFCLKNNNPQSQPITQKFIFNNIKTSDLDCDELAVTITLANSQFEVDTKTFNTDQKKINYVINQLRGPLRIWAAKQLHLNPAVKKNYPKFCTLLFDNSSVSLTSLRSDFYNCKQGSSELADYINKMELLGEKISARKEDVLHLILQGINPRFRSFLIYHRIPEDYNQAISDLLYFHKKFVSLHPSNHSNNQSAAYINNLSTKRGPLPQEEKNRRRINNLCLYCASDAHLVADCTLKPNRIPSSYKSGDNSTLDIKDTCPSYFSVTITFNANNNPFTCEALLDSGADNNFMSLEIANKLGIALGPKTIGFLGNSSSFEVFQAPRTYFHTGNLLHYEDFKVSPQLSHPVILGLPWWYKNTLTFDYRARELILQGEHLPLNWVPKFSSLLCIKDANPIPGCIEEFSNVFSSELSNQLPPHRDCDIKIDLLPGKQPSHGKIIPLSVSQSKALKAYLEEQLALGFMSTSKSSCSSPIFFVKKSDGSLRPCVDYRKLNEITVKNRYPLPSADALSDKLFGATVFSKVDLKAAFNQLRVAEGDEWKTAVRTSFGLYEYNVMPFGLCNAPSCFQTLINECLLPLIDVCVIVYLDDVLIFSKDIDEHKQHLKEVFSRLSKYKLFCKPNKCIFFQPEVTFLGYVIKEGGFTIAPDKVKAILEYPIPKNRRELRSFLGLANFCRKFISNFSKIALPLTNLTKTKLPFKWNSQAEAAIHALKLAFTNAPVLITPDANKEFYLECDASDFAMGAVLKQEHKGKLHPVAYFSEKFSPAAANYHVYDKELMAIVDSLKHWRRFLEGSEKPVIIHTDHKNLIYFTEARILNQRQARWSMELLLFDFKIKYIPGSSNTIPDALSRRPDHFNPSNKETISAPMLQKNVFINNIQTLVQNPLDSEIFTNQRESTKYKQFVKGELTEDWSRVEGILLFRKHIWVLDNSLRRRVIELFHNTVSGGHNGVRKTIHHIKTRYLWKGLAKHVKDYIKNCDTCLRIKIQNQKPIGLLTPPKQAELPWKSITVDFITGLPTSDGFDAILVVVDRYTKYSLFIPCFKTCNARELAQLFLKNVFLMFGTPNEIISDRGVVFTSNFWKEFSKSLGVDLKFSSAYHPQTDGQTERTNQILEQYLRGYVDFNQDNWNSLLHFAQYNYNVTFQTSIRMTPSEALMGINPSFLPGRNFSLNTVGVAQRLVDLRIARVQLRASLTKAINAYTLQANKHRIDLEYHVGDLVYLSSSNLPLPYQVKKLSPRRVGPFRISRKLSKVAYQLELPISWNIHNVFHIALLTKTSATNVLPLPPPLVNTEIDLPNPERILDHRFRYRVLYFLVKWTGMHAEEATWEQLTKMREHLPLVKHYLCSRGLVLEGDTVRIL